MESGRCVTLTLTVIFSLLTVLSLIGAVSANVPTVAQIDNISQGSSGKVRLQISHLNPSATHYVDTVEVDVDGRVVQFNLQPQSSDPFTVEIDLGQIQGSPNVRARAHCILHGWSSWSNQIQVPEFTEAAPTMLAALLGALLITRKVTK